jgi:hypothetical protein
VFYSPPIRFAHSRRRGRREEIVYSHRHIRRRLKAMAGQAQTTTRRRLGYAGQAGEKDRL